MLKTTLEEGCPKRGQDSWMVVSTYARFEVKSPVSFSDKDSRRTREMRKTMIAQNEKLPVRPRLVLAYADSQYAALCCRQLRRLGWEVHLANRGTEARRLARDLRPAVVVIDTELHDESGWLTCDKLQRELPGQRIVLVGPASHAQDRRLAAFVGAAALVNRQAGAAALVDEVLGAALPAVG
jgi:ActR/RegA family two-component response regulator